MTTKRKATKKKASTVLILRTCAADMISHNGFKWPTKGPVKCDDWNPTAACGNGLHGFLWGEGDGSLADWSEDAKWLVVEVAASDVVAIDSAKVKFPRGAVVYCGDRLTATKLIAEKAPNTVKAIVGGTSTSGDGGTSTSGYGGTSTSGYGGTSTSGYGGTSTSGDGGTSTSGDGGTSTSGYGGTSTSGVGGTSTSGYRGTSTSGYRGTSTSGYGGEIRIRWWDEKTNRYRTAVGYIGEDGLVAGVAYCCRKGKFYRKDTGEPASPTERAPTGGRP